MADPAEAPAGTAGGRLRMGVLGVGQRGGAIGTLWTRAGHPVVFSYRRGAAKPEEPAARAGPTARAGTPAAAAPADVVLLATWWPPIADVLGHAGAPAGALAGKVLVTCVRALPCARCRERAAVSALP